jgi:hypothetical protein
MKYSYRSPNPPRTHPRKMCPICERVVAFNLVTRKFRLHHDAPAGEYCSGSGLSDMDGVTVAGLLQHGHVEIPVDDEKRNRA